MATIRPILLGVACWVGTAPTTAPVLPPHVSGSFTVVEDGVPHAKEVHDVLCTRDAGWADIWIRLAGPAAEGGAPAYYLDLDVCGAPAGSVYSPMDPRAARCAEGASWDVWWHGDDGGVFVNGVDSEPCALTLTPDGRRLSGSFACDGLSEDGGSRRVVIAEGRFTCELTGSRPRDPARSRPSIG